jgi:hypothetical protein
LHINNIYKEGELDKISTVKDYLTVQSEGGKNVRRKISYFNLDVIISVGYRVKSHRGTLFRQWANRIIKDYLLRGYAVNQRFEHLENRVTETENRIAETEKKIGFFVKTSSPPVEGIFFDGQIFDAYVLASDLIKSAKKSIILFDNYIDENVLLLLSKRKKGVNATIYTASIPPQLKLDVQKHNAQYPAIKVNTFTRSHDRFLLIDSDVYFIGASLKDLGKKMFAFAKMKIDAKPLLHNIFAHK